MDATAKSLEIDRLSRADRMLLLGKIWDSIAAEAEALEVPRPHRDGLERRLAAHDAGPGSGLSWEDVKARLQK